LSASYLGVSEGTLQWVLYEQLKRIFRTEKKTSRTFNEKLREALGAAFFAKTIATVATYPHEVNLPKDIPDKGCTNTITPGALFNRRSETEI
jgi:hypothetical protein